MPAQTKPQPLKEWLEEQRNSALGKMGMNIADEKARNYYQGLADGYFAALMHMAVYGEGEK